jgi:hypothetical protein
MRHAAQAAHQVGPLLDLLQSDESGSGGESLAASRSEAATALH